MRFVSRWHVARALAVVITTLAGTVRGQDAPARWAFADSAEALLKDLMAHQGIPGLAAAVARDSELVWAAGLGLANVELGTPVTPATRFRIGSISKPLTAAAAGRLLEEGRLDLDAPVQRYVSRFPEKRGVVTTRLLGGHLAGIRHYRGAEFLSAVRYPTVLDGLAIFAADSLLAEPGSRFIYSSYGWNLVSAVVEAAAKRPFLSYMHDAVFAPLGMERTIADFTDSIIPGRTGYYVRDSTGVLLNGPFVDNSYKWAGGGFLSTVEDLARFGLAHLNGRILRPETLKVFWTSQRTTEGEETGYGFGWYVGRDGDDRRIVSHGGSSIGGRGLLLLYPDERVVVVVLTNLSGARFGEVPRQIAALALAR